MSNSKSAEALISQALLIMGEMKDSYATDTDGDKELSSAISECEALLSDSIHLLDRQEDTKSSEQEKSRISAFDMDIALSYFTQSITNITTLIEAITYQKDIGEDDIIAMLSAISNTLVRGHNNICDIAYLLIGNQYDKAEDIFTRLENKMFSLIQENEE